MHMDVWKLMSNVNKFFAWNLPFFIVQWATETTYEVYWIFLIIQFEWNPIYISGKTEILVPKASSVCSFSVQPLEDDSTFEETKFWFIHRLI